MRILHTSDWHVGKTLRGESRLEEHRAVLAEIVEIARDEQADIVLVTGDLFESAAPPPEAKRLVFETLLALHATGAKVVAIAGNHDHARELDAVAPVFATVGIVLAGTVKPPERAGVIEHTTTTGERARIALLPFLSQRYAVRAQQVLDLHAADATGAYAARVEAVISALCASFAPDAVNVLAAHLTVNNAELGGGERRAQTIFDYYVPPAVFPITATYTALGHIHRAQRVEAACPAWYAGSPVQVDFGEHDDKQVLMVDATAGAPAKVRTIPITSGWRLRTLRGTLGELRPQAGSVGDDRLRIQVVETARVGLADEVRELFPGAVDVQIVAPDRDGAGSPESQQTRLGSDRNDRDLLTDYLATRNENDPDLVALFSRLLDEVNADARGETGERVGAG